jgi:predicted acylesterase/phospholipase RssA
MALASTREASAACRSCAHRACDATISRVQGPRNASRPKIGFVLSGGGSRGAYEAGIIHYLRTDLAKRIGRHVPIDIVTGTSVGAINAAFLAASMDEPEQQANMLVAAWRALRIEELISLKAKDMVRGVRLLLGGDPPPPPPGSFRYGGLLDTSGLEKFVIRAIPWRGIEKNLRSRALHAMCSCRAPNRCRASGAAIHSSVIARHASVRVTCSHRRRFRCCSPP